MKLRLTAFLLAFAMLGAFVLAPLSAEAKKPTASGPTATLTNVAGTFADGTTGTFTGTATVTEFVNSGGALAAVVTVTGQVFDAAGTSLGTASQTLTVPAQASGSCQILHLELGPLDLDLLGLQVHLDKVVLDITAQSGSGNLLGNLLCAVANLLNGGLNIGTALNQLVNLLNQILGLLG